LNSAQHWSSVGFGPIDEMEAADLQFTLMHKGSAAAACLPRTRFQAAEVDRLAQRVLALALLCKGDTIFAYSKSIFKIIPSQRSTKYGNSSQRPLD
jgi:hypothetical protein